MRSILEKAFVALLNEEHDAAEELFHKFMVERARQIHEANRAGDDSIINENWDEEITTESYFTEEDLADLEDDEDEVADDEFEAGEETADDEFDAGEEVADDEFDAGEEVADDEFETGEDDLEGEPMEVEDRLDDLEDQIASIKQEFEAMMDNIGDDDTDFGMDDGELPSDEMGDDEFADDEFEAGEEAEDEELADNVVDDMADDGDDDYDDVTESITSELEKVQVTLSDGHGIGKGETFSQVKTAAIPQKGKDARQGGEPIKMKVTTHKGYARETAPTVADMKPRRNNVKKPITDKVPDKGDKSALVNKSAPQNNRSPITPTKPIRR